MDPQELKVQNSHDSEAQVAKIAMENTPTTKIAYTAPAAVKKIERGKGNAWNEELFLNILRGKTYMNHQNPKVAGGR
jgi:hypothetical protein